MTTKIITKNGNPYFSIDGSDYVPAAFRSFRPTPANVSLFNRSDVKLYQFLISGQLTGMDIPYSLYPPVWIEENEYDFDALDVQIDMFRRFAPDGKLWVFFQLDTPKAWMERDPTITDSFLHLEAALFDECWKKAASDYARALIDYCEEKYGDLVFAYAFTAGRSCEWFVNSVEIVETPEKLAAWREYTGDPNALLPTIRELKSYRPAEIEPTETTDGILLNKSDIIYRYHSFMCEASGKTVCRFASEIQEVLCHKKPLGTFYGYSDNESINLPTDAMTALESADIDLFFSPASYDKYRKIEGTAGFQLPVSSLGIHGKLYLHEIDHRTPLARFPLEAPVTAKQMGYRLNKYRLMDDCFDSEEEVIEVLRRELAATLAAGGSLWWFDFFGGYYATPALEAEVKRHIAVMERFRDCKFSRDTVAEIVVFHDGNALSAVRSCTKVTQDFIFHTQYEIAKIGAPYDYYHIDDMKNIDLSKYKLCIFPNAMAISDGHAEYIRTHLANTCKVWIYAPGYASEAFDTERMNRLIGMTTERFTAYESMPVTVDGKSFGFSAAVSPMFRVTDGEAEVIGRYANGTPAAAVKGKNTYFAVPMVPASVLRKAAEDAGVHMYTETSGGALSVSTQMIAFQTTEAEDITLTLPEDGVYEELFHGGIYETVSGKLSYRAEGGEVRLFMKLK